MSFSSNVWIGARAVLKDRMFSEPQIKTIIPKLSHHYSEQPKELAKIVDTWNQLMSQPISPTDNQINNMSGFESMPSIAKPPGSSDFGKHNPNINMTHILTKTPELLLIDPKKLLIRHEKVNGFGIARDTGQFWNLLYYASKGFYLQDYSQLCKKIYYIENNIIDFLYIMKEQKEMRNHPILKSAQIVEYEFDHIRTRYLFALRSGYKHLSHLYPVRRAIDMPNLMDMIASDDEDFLKEFAPYCNSEEYDTFSKLIKDTDIDSEDAEIVEKLSELQALNA